MLLVLLLACLAAAEPGAPHRRSLQAARAKPTCPAAFLLLPGSVGRRRLPACSQAPATAAARGGSAATKPAAARPAAAAAAAAAADLSPAYPCPVSNATCFCLWKQATGAPLGYWADTDPSVACRSVGFWGAPCCVERQLLGPACIPPASRASSL